MKLDRLFIIPILAMLAISQANCTPEQNGPQRTTKWLDHPKKEEINLLGSVIVVDGGIMIILQNGPLKAIPTILIPANDSAGTMLKNSYNTRLNHSYQISGKPWVKLAGNFLREDSILPIFKYSWVEFLDASSEMKGLQEMEE